MNVIVGACAIKHHDPNTDLCENRRCNPPHLRSIDNLEVGHGRKRIGSTGPPNSLVDLGSYSSSIAGHACCSRGLLLCLSLEIQISE